MNATAIIEWLRKNGIIGLFGGVIVIVAYVNNQERDIESNAKEVLDLRKDMAKGFLLMKEAISAQQSGLASHNVSDAHQGARSRLDRLEVGVEKDVRAIHSDLEELKRNNNLIMSLLRKMLDRMDTLRPAPSP